METPQKRPNRNTPGNPKPTAKSADRGPASAQVPFASSSLEELLHAVLGHLDAGIAVAQRGLDEAERTGDRASEQFFHRCLLNFHRTQADADSFAAVTGRSSSVATHPSQGTEQVSAAASAPGDGAPTQSKLP